MTPPCATAHQPRAATRLTYSHLSMTAIRAHAPHRAPASPKVHNGELSSNDSAESTLLQRRIGSSRSAVSRCHPGETNGRRRGVAVAMGRVTRSPGTPFLVHVRDLRSRRGTMVDSMPPVRTCVAEAPLCHAERLDTVLTRCRCSDHADTTTAHERIVGCCAAGFDRVATLAIIRFRRGTEVVDKENAECAECQNG